MSILDRLRRLLGGGDDGPVDRGRRSTGGRDGVSAVDDSADQSDAFGAERFPPGDPLHDYADRWERAERGMDSYVVRPPEEGPTTSVRRCSTLEETRRRLEFWYGDDSIDH